MDLFTAGCAHLGLTINTAKTVVILQPPPSAEYNTPRINVNGAQLKNLETFAYLGSTLSRNTKIDDEVAQWYLQSKSSLRSAAGLRKQSRRYLPEHQTEDVQGRRLDGAPLWIGDLDSLLERNQEAGSLPSHLPP
ncbi:unnamed protein product [Schistocephalus solidus]|uniref:Reverse transcriptase domain-containing protein n=1 Tax=Schistocephalus solidus TaxID=70667 RepID=A0A183TQG2_SCHSO|nr:unnamed protein product [Schistocephalus solidus]